MTVETRKVLEVEATCATVGELRAFVKALDRSYIEDKQPLGYMPGDTFEKGTPKMFVRATSWGEDVPADPRESVAA